MKIAIVKLSALGDIVHAMVALQFIKTMNPKPEIDWIIEERYAGILADNPHIQQILTVNLKALKNQGSGIFREAAKIKAYAAKNYDLVIDAQGLIKSACVARLLSKNCTGFDQSSIREKPAAWFYRNTVSYPYDGNTIERQIAVLTQPLGLRISHAQIIEKQPFLFFSPPSITFAPLPARQKMVLFVIGSTWPSRNYPKEKYLDVINSLKVNSLICWGTDSERQAALWLSERCSAQILPALSLNDLKFVISQSDLVIGNDTGPTHMAWAMNRPSITLFGPTPISRVLETPINKTLKSSSIVNPFKLNKQDFSIGEISSEAVITLANTLL